jgi:hypothetical protein
MLNGLMTITASQIVSLAAETMFGRPLVTNVARAILVEAMVATALQPDWTWCSADYMAFDFLHPNGCRLEVKQTAAKQTWPQKQASRPQWDVRARTGRWEGTTWLAEPGRNADIYVLAHHPIYDTGTVDHRDPAQWNFYCVATTALPSTGSIGMASLLRFNPRRTDLAGLASAVADLRVHHPGACHSQITEPNVMLSPTGGVPFI